MITLFRIDERLIHGQIAIKWSRHTGVDHIIVANDAASMSPLTQKTLRMAAPSDIKTAIKSVDDAISIMKDPRCEAMKILLLVNCPEDAIKILQEFPAIKHINIGNYGRVAPEKPGHKRKSYGGNIFFDDIELAAIKEIMDMGVNLIYQTTPEERAENLSYLLNK